MHLRNRTLAIAFASALPLALMSPALVSAEELPRESVVENPANTETEAVETAEPTEKPAETDTSPASGHDHDHGGHDHDHGNHDHGGHGHDHDHGDDHDHGGRDHDHGHDHHDHGYDGHDHVHDQGASAHSHAERQWNGRDSAESRDGSTLAAGAQPPQDSAQAAPDIRQASSEQKGTGSGVVWAASPIIGALILTAGVGVIRRRRG
ncbi:hypothetical protein OS123_03935 [Corynebacterium sp. P5875]|uniref:Uncharacterized protein n=1 Tax=Corynebacterium antarcticum TaxID=2800405 RepID=A0A9Q4CC51_9CORY|nr:hypothetical protein [Corynebacterium antarcticum]MCX7537695.1 hypothetical protein [Corynebacterium antarcticum]